MSYRNLLKQFSKLNDFQIWHETGCHKDQVMLIHYCDVTFHATSRQVTPRSCSCCRLNSMRDKNLHNNTFITTRFNADFILNISLKANCIKISFHVHTNQEMRLVVYGMELLKQPHSVNLL